jgi:hypothetical protein
LAGGQLLQQPLFVLERTVRLKLVIREFFSMRAT